MSKVPFWAGMAEDEEFVLECDKDLKAVVVLPGISPTEISYYAKSWAELDELYKMFIADRFEKQR
ncbi:hypothetical protein SAMN05421747_103208 [Parapedobacter composti]|uniref:Uncharacterized protein n=1 Tax=Parapedobacter composti TaxID=623281 RepID=A0A1I1FXM6_9SPHI|nr:hypothetical protein [Parapedobacter composti]SFC03806.1 hypothetical protein SAMN05421747_103208 [Parapedobacter composti]